MHKCGFCLWKVKLFIIPPSFLLYAAMPWLGEMAKNIASVFNNACEENQAI
jgi:hypothetical protein